MRFGPGFIAKQNSYQFENSEAEEIVSSFTVPPSEDRKELIDSIVGPLVSGGAWANLAFLYFPQAHTEQASRINWRDPANYTLIGGGGWAADAGWASGSLSSPWTRNPTLGTSQNDFFFGVYLTDTWTTGVYLCTFGPSSGEASGGVMVRRDATNKIIRVNAAANVTTAVANGGGTGGSRLHYVRRGNSTQCVVGSIGNAGTPSETTIASNSAAPTTTTNTFCGSGLTTKCIAAGRNLSSSDIQALRTAIVNYRAGL